MSKSQHAWAQWVWIGAADVLRNWSGPVDLERIVRAVRERFDQVASEGDALAALAKLMPRRLARTYY